MAKKYNCVKNGVPYFRKTKTIGHNLDGTPIKKEFYGDGEKDVNKQIEEYMNLIKNGVPINFEQITVGQMLEDWLYNIKRLSKDIRSSSFDRYETTYRNHLKDTEITGLQLISINSLLIQRFYNKKYESGTSENQIKEINKVLKNFFNWCVEQEYIRKNPCSSRLIELPGKAEELDCDIENKIYFFNENEIKKIVSQANQLNDTTSLIVLLALGTGLRQGEILGISKKNLDLDNKTIKVEQNLRKIKIYDSKTEYHYETKLQKPKTRTSIRLVNIPNNLVPILKNYIQETSDKYIKNNLSFSNESLIFVTKNCSPIDATDLRRSWKRFLKRINVPYQKFHALRHTYASVLFKNGASILEVKELLGHSDSKITEKIYIHLYPQSKKNIVNKLNYIFT